MIQKIRSELIANADDKTRQSSIRFFREEINPHGVRSAIVGRISRELYKEVRGRTKQEVFAICEDLWKSGYLEESFIACNWSYNQHKNFEPGDFVIFEKWVDLYINNWASCDTFCNHTVGEFIQMYPGYLSELKRWAGSDNRWKKRAAAVSLIIPARHGKFLEDVFEIAGILLTDGDDMVQKGYGWMLKVASQAHLEEVYDFVTENKRIMPRTALRYAIEKMPPEMRRIAMQKSG